MIISFSSASAFSGWPACPACVCSGHAPFPGDLGPSDLGPSDLGPSDLGPSLVAGAKAPSAEEALFPREFRPFGGNRFLDEEGSSGEGSLCNKGVPGAGFATAVAGVPLRRLGVRDGLGAVVATAG